MLGVCFSLIAMERGKILPRLENTHPDFVASAHYVDLANAADISLQTLLMACEPAPFGIDNKDVLDDTYRKAWKITRQLFNPAGCRSYSNFGPYLPEAHARKRGEEDKIGTVQVKHLR